MGGLLALPLADTLKRAAVSGAAVRSSATVPRESLWRAMTPQMSRLGDLRAALQAALVSGRQPTDEAQALEWQGFALHLVAGEPTNLKVTTAGDVRLAEAILAAARDRGAKA